MIKKYIIQKKYAIVDIVFGDKSSCIGGGTDNNIFPEELQDEIPLDGECQCL